MGTPPSKTLIQPILFMMDAPRLLLALSLPRHSGILTPTVWESLKDCFPAFEIIQPEDFSPEDWREAITSYNPEILITGWDIHPVPSDPPPALRYICHLTGGIRRFIPRSYIERGIRVTNWGNSISHTISEMGLFLILHGLRNATATHDNLHVRRRWKEDIPPNRSLFGRRVGIHGFGRIARELVALLQPFQVEVSAFSPPVPKSIFREHNVTPAPSLQELFARNEIVVELEGHTPETAGMVKAEHLQAMPDQGLLVVVGRAGLIDETAFHEEIRTGRIHAALDVFWEEPLPADSPLRGLRNLALFPHPAGPTPDQLYRCGERAIENLRRYCAGEALLEPLDPEAYDRIT